VKKLCNIVSRSVAITAALLFASQASAMTFEINQELNGGAVTKVATLSIEQSGEDALFTLTGSFDDLSGQAFLKEIFFTGTGGEFVTGDGNTILGAPKTAFIADGGTNASVFYNWRVRFPTANNSDRFTGEDVATWTIKGVQATDFSNPMIKLNGSGGLTHAVAISPVPEADSWMMLIAGMGVLGFSLRRRAK
jgi:hypothetical protein